VVLFRLTVDGRPAATELGFVDRGQRAFLSYLGAFSPEFAEGSPGTVLTAASIAWGIRNGLGRYDLLPPESDFKARWADERRAVYAAVIPLTRAGRSLEPLMRNGRDLARTVFASLPTPLREFARAAQGRRPPQDPADAG
jgi:CelD/BcsL family acetyltransferase involved in cellulose biosynthesis